MDIDEMFVADVRPVREQLPDMLKQAENLSRAMMREDPKRYHTAEHVRDMLAEFYRRRDEFGLEFPELLQAAVLCHDIVYKVGAKDNEARSAAETVLHFSAVGLDPALTGKVVRLILATDPFDIIRHKRPYTSYERALLTLDWSYFCEMETLERAYRRLYMEFYWDGHPDQAQNLKAGYIRALNYMRTGQLVVDHFDAARNARAMENLHTLLTTAKLWEETVRWM